MNTKLDSRPLVTFALFAYNQESYVREAIEGAFSQTYSPLEIILSDDCSPDGTFAIMQEMTEAYEGPHKIILNRNEKNLGMGGHVNTMMNMASGELVVMAAGDDISLSARVEKLVESWLHFERPSGIASALVLIDKNGKQIENRKYEALNSSVKSGMLSPSFLKGLMLKGSNFGVRGCSAAWSKTTWEKFGCLNENVTYEDLVFSFRAMLDSGIGLIEDSLVQYRTHDENISHNLNLRDHPSKKLSLTDVKKITLKSENYNLQRLYCYHNFKKDIQLLSERDDLDDVLEYINVQLEKLKIVNDWWEFNIFKKIKLWNSSPHSRFFNRVLTLFGFEMYCRVRFIAINVYRYFK